MIKENKTITLLLEENNFNGLTNYLVENSNLPGRRVNLSLISTVADFFASNSTVYKSWYRILENWFDTKVDGNSSETILVLTALESFGATYIHSEEIEQKAIEKKLIASLNDNRWRVREIVTESYKRIGLSSYTKLINLFEWILSNKPTPLEIRGILATVAHPELLVSKEQLNFSQKILAQSFNYYISFDASRFTKEDKVVLKKGLAFAPSVIVSKNPTVGFPFFERLIRENGKEIHTIIKENLKKKRLEKFYPSEVENLLLLLTK
ncbi:hypothetical protein ACYSNW_10910 [Enterococcus sp. LJL99]